MEFRFFLYKTPLNIAIERENIDIVDLLLMNDKIDANKERKFSRQNKKEDILWKKFIDNPELENIYQNYDYNFDPSDPDFEEYEELIPYIILNIIFF